MSYIEDRWLRNGEPTSRHGRGLRYRVRWLTGDMPPREQSRSFGSREDADELLAALVEAACPRPVAPGELICSDHAGLGEYRTFRASGDRAVRRDTCVAPGADGPEPHLVRLCGSWSSEVIAGLPLCPEHAAAVGKEVADRQELAELMRVHELIDDAKKWNAQGFQIVYYLLRTDGLIKIGTTTNPAQRFGTLRSEHGPLRILATHCGGYDREDEMHDRFASARVTGEWFRPCGSLISWIREIRQIEENAATVLPGTVPLEDISEIQGALF